MSEIENEESLQEEEILEEENLEIVDGDYSPDLTYKFKDETRNFDERFASAVKTKEDEDALRDLYTRADGLDSYKDKYSGLEGRYGDLENKSKSLVGGFETLQSLVDKKDMRGLMQAMGVTKDQVLDYSETLLDEEELPEKEKALLKENREMTQRMADMESRMTNLNSQVSGHSNDREVTEVETMIKSDSFSPIASAMENMGFNVFDQIVAEGRNMTAVSGKTPSAVDVMNLVASKYGRLVQSTEVINNDQGNGVKPTLPSVNSSAASNVGGKVRSLEDLYRLADSM